MMISKRRGPIYLSGKLSEDEIKLLGRRLSTIKEKIETKYYETRFTAISTEQDNLLNPDFSDSPKIAYEESIVEFDGISYDTSLIYHGLEALETTVKMNNLKPWTAEDSDLLEILLSIRAEDYKEYKVEAWLEVWLLFEKFLEEDEYQRNFESSDGSDDWAPPDNFEYGTDDEQEIHKNFCKRESKRK